MRLKRAMWGKPEFRDIPKGSIKVASKHSSAVAYLYSIAGFIGVKCFVGKSVKPAAHYSFRSEEKRADYVKRWLIAQDEYVARKAAAAAEVKAKKAAGHKLEVGSVLRASWGYDQTNIDYYEVVAKVGSRMVEIRELCQESVESELFMQGKCVPLPGQYKGEAMRKVVSASGDSVRIYSFASAYLIQPEVKIIAGVEVKAYAASSWSSYA